MQEDSAYFEAKVWGKGQVEAGVKQGLMQEERHPVSAGVSDGRLDHFVVPEAGLVQV